ncbi:MAG: DJ-1/PfpI family protein [Chloroflexota bacterium]|nr:DJ-1/PfpI family protein [Chloroflexota bacterium]
MTDPNSPAHCSQVGILIFEDVEVLDFCGPFEVFSITTAEGQSADEAQLFDVHIIAETSGIVRCRNGLRVEPHYTIDDHPELGIVVVPGGRGTRRELSNPRILAWIEKQSERADLMTSVCTGSFLLAATGLLDGKSATTHWASIDWLRKTYPAITVRDDQRYVDEGRIITSAGVSAGIDMALHVVERMHGSAVARQSARHMEYDGWT